MQEELLLKSGVIIRELRDKLEALRNVHTEPIAIIGMACRFPCGVNDLDSFWRLIERGEITAAELSSARLGLEGGGSPRVGSFLEDVDLFDAAFFDISEREAIRMDPQQRIFLEVAWQALEDAGQTRASLEGSETGTFVGVHNHSNDYFNMQTADRSAIDAYTALGTGHDVIAGRLAYWLDLRGPASAINTACSSSLVAVHAACQSLREQDCQIAVVGGVNLQFTPVSTICGLRLNMLAPDGRSKTFDAAADGFGRGEGCGVVVLKRLSAAERDGDRIHAVLLGSAVNQDGRTNGLTAPNGLAQRRVIERAVARAQRAAAEVGYIEAHGTGTPLGDPIEVEALCEVYGSGGLPCALGSVKANLGHLEAAAGMASLIKAVLVTERGMVPPVAGLKTRSPHLDQLDQTRLFLPTQSMPWTQSQGKRLAAVSAFGWSGTNAHLLLEEAPAVPARPIEAGQNFVLTLSAATPESLRQLGKLYEQALLALPADQLASFCYTANQRRTRHLHQLTVTGVDAVSLVDNLRTGQAAPAGLAGGTTTHPVITLPPYAYDRRSYWLEGVKTQSNGPADSSAPDDWFYRVQWHRAPFAAPLADLGAAAQTSLQKRWPALVQRPRDTAESLNQEALTWMQAALLELGLPQVPGEVFSVRPPAHARLFERILNAMVDARVLSERNGTFVTTGTLLPPPPPHAEDGCSPERQVLRKCGAALADVLRGRRDPLDLLFGGSGPGAEELYKESQVMRVSYELLREVFDRTLDDVFPLAPARVLELGAGTGAATAVLLKGQTRPIAEYHFTDLARTLVAKAETEFQEYPFLRGRLLDIEAALPTDGDGTYDLIVAANVLHATASIRASLLNCARLLKPGGALLLLETTAPRAWVDLVFGLTPGWWRYTDLDLRQQDALLRPDRWLTVLGEQFADVVAVPLPQGAGDVVEQTVFVARKAEVTAPIGKWGILGDAGGLADRLTNEVSRLGGTSARIAELDDPRLDDCSHVIWLPPPAGKDPVALVTFAVDLLRRIAGKLWIVTRGAQPAAAQASREELAQAALWGFGATAAIELPQRWGGLIDLDRAEDPREAAWLCRQMQETNGELRIALREGTRHFARFERLPAPRPKQMVLRKDAAYLLTGATGAVAPGIARWFADRGARCLVLVARRSGDDTLAAELRARGILVHSVACDVADPEQVKRLFSRFGSDWPSLRGVVHAAAQIEAAPIADVRAETIAAAFRAKALGTLALQRHLAAVDFFVCFSSAAATLGARNRAHYGAANAFVDAFSEAGQRDAPAPLSIAWGSWDAQVSGSNAERELIQRSGYEAMPTAQALDAMERLIGTGIANATVARLNWAIVQPALAVRGQQRFVSGIKWARPAVACSTQSLAAPSELDRRETIVNLIETEIRHLFGLPAGSPVDPERGFFDMGMDSLMSVELKNRLEAALGRSLPGTLTLNHPTISALAKFLEPAATTPTVSAPSVPDYGPIAELSREETLDALAEELQLLGGQS